MCAIALLFHKDEFMEPQTSAFKEATKSLKTSEGTTLSEVLADGRHALVLLRHFG